MGEKIDIIVEVDDSELKDAQREIDQFESDSTAVIKNANDSSRDSFMHTLSMARSMYTIGLGIVKATGTTVNYFFRSMISAAFGAIQLIGSILTAESFVPGMAIPAALGLAELGVAIGATIAAQNEQADLARSLRGVAMSLGGVNQLIGNMYFIV